MIQTKYVSYDVYTQLHDEYDALRAAALPVLMDHAYATSSAIEDGTIELEDGGAESIDMSRSLANALRLSSRGSEEWAEALQVDDDE